MKYAQLRQIGSVPVKTWCAAFLSSIVFIDIILSESLPSLQPVRLVSWLTWSLPVRAWCAICGTSPPIRLIGGIFSCQTAYLPLQIPRDDQQRQYDAGDNQTVNQNIHLDTSQAICYSMGGEVSLPLPLATRSASQLRGAPQ